MLLKVRDISLWPVVLQNYRNGTRMHRRCCMEFMIDSTMAFLIGITILITAADWYDSRTACKQTTKTGHGKAA